MKTEVKAFSRKPLIDTRDQAGKVTFTARDEIDAYVLAAIYQGWCTSEFPKVKSEIIAAAKQIMKEHKKRLARIAAAKTNAKGE